jgi:hypothetical protein
MEVKRLTDAIAGKNASPYRLQCAQIVAEAQLQLMRIHAAKAAMLDLAAARQIGVVRPYGDVRSQINHGPAMPNSEPSFSPQMDSSFRMMGDGLSDAFLHALRQIVRLERYEYRAFSRRQRAIRKLDVP